jgi:hypothetical protein
VPETRPNPQSCWFVACRRASGGSPQPDGAFHGAWRSPTPHGQQASAATAIRSSAKSSPTDGDGEGAGKVVLAEIPRMAPFFRFSRGCRTRKRAECPTRANGRRIQAGSVTRVAKILDRTFDAFNFGPPFERHSGSLPNAPPNQCSARTMICPGSFNGVAVESNNWRSLAHSAPFARVPGRTRF